MWDGFVAETAEVCGARILSDRQLYLGKWNGFSSAKIFRREPLLVMSIYFQWGVRPRASAAPTVIYEIRGYFYVFVIPSLHSSSSPLPRCVNRCSRAFLPFRSPDTFVFYVFTSDIDIRVNDKVSVVPVSGCAHLILCVHRIKQPTSILKDHQAVR